MALWLSTDGNAIPQAFSKWICLTSMYVCFIFYCQGAWAWLRLNCCFSYSCTGFGEHWHIEIHLHCIAEQSNGFFWASDPNFFCLRSQELRCRLYTDSSIHFWLTKAYSWESVEYLGTENISSRGVNKTLLPVSWRNALPFELLGSVFYYRIIWNTAKLTHAITTLHI